MAGQPKKRAMIMELDRRAAEDERSVFEYVEAWIASGRTLAGLAEDISTAIKPLTIMREQLSRYVHSLDAEAEARLIRARARGSFAMVEQAHDQAVKEHDKDAVPGVKLAVDTRLRVAAMFNREELGERKQLNVAITLPGQHLDALRRRALPHATVALAPVDEVKTVDFTVESVTQVQE